MSAVDHASDFTGTARYKVRRRLGAGSFGVVYEAEDTLLGGSVALKVLHQPSGNALYRFKNEFRALADLKHENLVGLHELTNDKDRWFFTMELVRGHDIVRSVWGDSERTMREAGEDSSVQKRLGGKLPFDIDLLRDAFAQLVRGVLALHDAGKIHRDIKPSNILVDESGRVVLLDFGLVTEIADAKLSADAIVGTPAYMAPEQAFAEDVSGACDFYSIGCVLYFTLTGRLPISGKSTVEVLTRKQSEVPQRPRDVRPEVPQDLDDLCMDLLERDAQKRPSGAEVLERLGSVSRSTSAPRLGIPMNALVGRGTEQATLAHAYRTMRDGRAVVVTVQGRSGMGKTALVRRFIEQAERADPEVVALTGRCYERESVPYKALDALIDGLRRYIRRLPELERNAILPRNLAALTRLFPVFTGVANDPQRRFDNLRDTMEMRRRGFSALHELLARIADRQHVILFIDDLQWGDYDSASALAEILSPPDPPPLLLVLGFRSEDAGASSIIKGLSSLARGPHLERFDVEIGPLSEAESRELVTRLVEDGVPTSPDGKPSAARTSRIDQIVREGRGMPFMLGELVTFMNQVQGAEERASALAQTSPSLVDELVRARAALLDEEARTLLETMCVSGQPMSRASACRAAGLSGERAQASLDALRTAKLVRARGTADAEEIEAMHDRVSEAITHGLAADRLAQRHAAIADALERESGVDAERLGMHLHGAGEDVKALGYLERAAAQASETLAFDRAVRLYRLALDIESTPELQRKLADALVNAGHGGEAGRVYLAAAEGAPPDEVLGLRRRAAEAFLRSGHIDDALPVVDDVLAQIGLSIPATPGRSLTSLLVQRAKLWLRGLEFTERKDVPAEELLKIDVCWTIGNGMGGVDIIRGADFQARHLWLALRAGEPYRISRALSWEAVLSAIEGGKSGLARSAELAPRATALAERLQNPHAQAWAAAATAIDQFCRADWPRARKTSESAIALFQEHCADIGWEVGSMEMWWWLPAARWLGDYNVLRRRAAACAREAAARGDLYTVVGTRTHCLPHLHLVADKPDEASREANDAILEWSQKRWLTHHWCNAVVQGHAALYSGDFGKGLAELDAATEEMKRALQYRLQTMRIQMLDISCRMAAAAALAEPKETDRHRELIGRAERDAALLEKEGLAWATSLALVGRAACAKARRDETRARELYARATSAFADQQMGVHAFAAVLQVAQIEGGATGQATVTDTLKRLLERGVVNPERFASMLVP